MTEINTKYTEVTINIDDANPKEGYFGYLSVSFDVMNQPHAFFMESNDMAICDAIREMFKTIPNYNPEKDIHIEDAHILINLARVKDVSYAPDIVGLVKKFEREFDRKME